MSDVVYTFYQSPVGTLKLTADDLGLSSVTFLNAEPGLKEQKTAKLNKILTQTIKQLDLYFKGKLKVFDLPLNLNGTKFQVSVWQELTNIPYAAIATYKEVAIATGNPRAVRAVGNANNHNNLPIVIPCHRVIGSNGKLVGYAGGLWRKQQLLNFEAHTNSLA